MLVWVAVVAGGRVLFRITNTIPVRTDLRRPHCKVSWMVKSIQPDGSYSSWELFCRCRISCHSWSRRGSHRPTHNGLRRRFRCDKSRSWDQHKVPIGGTLLLLIPYWKERCITWIQEALYILHFTKSSSLLLRTSLICDYFFTIYKIPGGSCSWEITGPDRGTVIPPINADPSRALWFPGTLALPGDIATVDLGV